MQFILEHNKETVVDTDDLEVISDYFEARQAQHKKDKHPGDEYYILEGRVDGVLAFRQFIIVYAFGLDTEYYPLKKPGGKDPSELPYFGKKEK